ncbi:MAG TPA: hypothetical protein VF470_08515 [Sphingomicrobium sp.]
MPTIAEIVTKFTADTAGMITSVKAAHTELQNTKKHADDAGKGITGMIQQALPMGAVIGVTGALAAGLGLTVKAAADSEVVMARTNSVLKSMGGASGQTAQSVSDLATHIMNLSGIDDEAVQTGENMLLTFGNIGKGVFPQATQAIADMATAMNQGMTPNAEQMQQQAILLGKALNDPVKGVTALRKEGVSLDESQQKLIATYMKHGQTAKAQQIILNELSKEFGGAAAASGQTFNGKLALLQATLGNVAESIGGMILPALTNMVSAIVPIISRLSDFAQYLKDNEGAMNAFKAVLVVAAAIIGTVLVASFVAWAIAAGAAAIATIAATWPVLAVIAAVALLVLGIKLLVEHWSQVVAFLQGVWNASVLAVQAGLKMLGQWFSNLGTWVHDGIMNAVAAIILFHVQLIARFMAAKAEADRIIGNLISSVVSFFASLPGRVWGIVSSFVGGIISQFISLEVRGLIIIASFIGGMIARIQGAIGQAGAAAASIGAAILGALGSLGGRLASLVRDAISNMIAAIRNMAGNVAGAFAGLFSGIHLPHFAAGGDVNSSGLAVVGEHGPEVVALPAGAHVYPHGTAPYVAGSDAPRSSSSGSGGAPIVLQVKLDGRTIAEASAPHIVGVIRQRLGVAANG